MKTRERTLTAGNVPEAADLIHHSLFTPELHGCDPVEACRELLDAGSMMGDLIDLVAPDGEFIRSMLDQGIYVIGFSYPVVPKGKARIRVQISAAHTTQHLDRALEGFRKVGKKHGLI